MNYNKPPLSIECQITQLIDRGMTINDKARAEKYLQHIGYYRLSAYWLPDEKKTTKSHKKNHSFKKSANFDSIIDLYVFDRKLRLLIIEAIERIEFSVRSNWANNLSLYGHSAHAYMNKKYFKDHKKHHKNIARIIDDIENSKEIFIRHYNEKYTSPHLPPIWAVVETLSLGSLSHWYENTALSNVKMKVAKSIGLPTIEVTESVLHCLTVLRNICAHHSRLWNRRFVMKLPNIKKFGNYLIQDKHGNQSQLDSRLYNYLIVIFMLLKSISPKTRWLERIAKLVGNSTNKEQQKNMGFPDDWEKIHIWQTALI